MKVPSPKQEQRPKTTEIKNIPILSLGKNAKNKMDTDEECDVTAPPSPPTPMTRPEAARPRKTYAVQSSAASCASYYSSSSSSSSSDESSGAFPIYSASRGDSSDESGAFPSVDDDDEEDLLPISAPLGHMTMPPPSSPVGSGGRSSSPTKTPSPSVPSYRAQGRQINASPSASPVPSPEGSIKKVIITKGVQRPDGGIGRTISADSSDDDIEEDRKSEQQRRRREEERISRLVVMAKQQQSFAAAWFAASSTGIEIVGPDGQAFQGGGRRGRPERIIGGRSASSASRSPSPARSDISNSSTISTKSEGPIDVDSGELWDTDDDDSSSCSSSSSSSSKKGIRKSLSDILGRSAKVKNKDDEPSGNIGSFAESLSARKSARSALSVHLGSRSVASSDSKSSRERVVRSVVPVTHDLERGVSGPSGMVLSGDHLFGDGDSDCTDHPSKEKWIDRPVECGRWKCSTFTILLLAIGTLIVVGVGAVVGIAMSDRDGGGNSSNMAIQESTDTDVDSLSSSPTVALTLSPSIPTDLINVPTLLKESAPPSVSASPSAVLSGVPSSLPTVAPSLTSSAAPSLSSSATPSFIPTVLPTTSPSAVPSEIPSMSPSTSFPSTLPTSLPSVSPSLSPSSTPTVQPSSAPSDQPSLSPSAVPTVSLAPSTSPSSSPTTFYRAQSYASIGDVLGNLSSLPIAENAFGDRTGGAAVLSKDGMVLAVSSDREDVRSGRVRVFRAVSSGRNLRQEIGDKRTRNLLSDVTWEPMGEPLAGRSKTDHFGIALGLSDDGSRLAVSEPGYDNGDAYNAGNVRVFHFNGTDWELVGDELMCDVRADLAGSALALSGDGSRVAVGAYRNNQQTGRVKLYELNNSTGNWTDMGSPLEGTGKEHFGFSLSLNVDGSVVAIGAPLSDDGGYVQTFSWVDALGEWNDGPRMYNGAVNADIDDRFGFSVSLSADGNRCAVGAPRYGGDGFPLGGIAFVFEYTPPSETANARWDQIGEGLNGDGPVRLQLGYSVSLSPDGQFVALGSPGDESIQGRVFVYHWNGDVWDYTQPIVSDTPMDDFGFSVSLSLNATRIAIGRPSESRGVGHGLVSVYEFPV